MTFYLIPCARHWTILKTDRYNECIQQNGQHLIDITKKKKKDFFSVPNVIENTRGVS